MGHGMHAVTLQWVDNMTKGTSRVIEYRGTGRDGCRYRFVYYSGDTIYSYGQHFPLAVAQRNRKGTVTGFVLNGDRSSSSTTGHQAALLANVQRSGEPYVTLPFSALEAADIVITSVKMLDRLDDRSEVREHVSATPPDNATWQASPITERRRRPDEEIAQIIASKQSRIDRYAEAGCPQTITIDDLAEWELNHTVTVGTRRQLRAGRASWSPEITIRDMGDGTKQYTWTTHRHWLGESLIEATTVSRMRVTCPSCRGRGHRKAAPRIPARPLNRFEFMDMLAGKGVNLNYERLTEAHHRHIDRRRAAREAWQQEWDCKRCNGAKSWPKTIRRRAKFLSGFDRNEANQTYFFCELPKTAATTVEAALEALKPDTVRIAEQMGRTVRRQGDIFAVALNVTKRDLRKRGAMFDRRGVLLGTNHVATETATLPDGTLLARGFMTHAPSGRRPDHARIKLAGGWYVVVKNTVPLTA